MIKIEVLDGKNCIGGNKILISLNNYSFFLDFGKNFNSWGCFFEEFLQPRSSVGIYDLWRLNLIPKFSNIYRDDLIKSDFKEIIKNEKPLNLKGVFLSHAHLDHSGLISILNEDIPIFMSSLSKVFLKAIEETGKKDIFSQFVKIRKKEEVLDEKGRSVLKSIKGVKENLEERNIFILDNSTKEGKILDLNYKSFSVDHSIFGSLGFYFEFEGCSLSYTGDIRFHGKMKEKSYNFVNELKKMKPDILIVEGTRV